MALQAGWLNRRISVSQPQVLDDGMAKVEGSPALLGSFACAEAPVSDGERARADQTQATITMRFLVRQSATTALIDETCTVTDRHGRVFGIASVKESVRWAGVDLRTGEGLEISGTAPAS